MTAHLHEDPRDFYRYSRYGLEHLFRKVGFEIVELEALSGFWLTFGQLFVYHMYRYNRGPLRWFRITDGLALLCRRFSTGSTGWTSPRTGRMATPLSRRNRLKIPC